MYCITSGKKGQLEKLKTGNHHAYTTEVYVDGVLELDIRHDVLVQDIRIRLATHNPERWEAILRFTQVPLTSHTKCFEDGKLVFESPCINTASVEQLCEVQGITADVAEKIVAHREAKGAIAGIHDLRQIEGVSDEQIHSLAAYTSR